ncbi:MULTISPECIES: DNA translocase FtsK [Odoribacteraceae]|jgi:S-DNA-T family DNA segregation ATPase FtsK/SpoIIIE|uniref:FtsK/SpoIIIE family DNA translocase n=1 Tax=Culturomica massiliensis TaxID=1841857 RepID=UPI000E558812|nr:MULTISPECIES: DNA translocase FtsK [Odoribacteraceae]RHV96903.1 DNA translocase FtsK [Odoribacter sp. OF09-27XD]
MKKTTSRRPAEKKQVDFNLSFLKEPRTRFIVGLTLILFSLYLLFSMIGFFFTGGIDQSLIDRGLRQIIANPEITAGNPAGKIGAWFSDLLINRWFGLSSFIFCYIFILAGICIAGKTIRNFPKKIILSIFGIIWISLFLGYVSELSYTLLNISSSYLYPGGAHGYFVSQWLNSVIGGIGTFFILLLTFVILLFFGFEKTFYKCIGFIKHLFSPKAKVVKTTDNVTAPEDIKETVAGLADLPEDLLTNTTEDPEFDPGKEFDKFPEDEYLNAPFTFETEKEAEKQEAERPEPGFENIPVSIEDFELPNDLSDIQSTDIPEKDKPDTPDSEAVELTINDENKEETLSTNLQPQGDYDPTLDLSNYRYPNLDLLEEHSSGNPKVTQEELDENKNKIVETLRNYKIEIVKIKATIGPTVTLYEIIPAPGVKISKIKNLEDDIALSLAALGIRIIAPIPGAGTIGIEVPNQNPEVVSMRGIIASKKFQESKYALPIAMGRTISNETYTFDLAKMPHLLVAGATGQGKSVGLNAIITSLLYKKHPAQLKFVMVDPKKVELSIYSVIEKHFLAKLPDEDEAIITETSKVINTLNSLCIEMDSRYDLLKEAQVRNIKEYNEKFVKRQLNPNKGHKYLPYIVVVVDEFADLIMTAGKDVEQPIARIAQLARAVGIHMIIATQRPSTNIITGVIKANFPARIAFKVASMIDSRTILDSPGANQLIGRGDMLISVGSEMTRVQCAFVDTPEIDAITNFIAGQQSYPSAFALPEYIPENEGGGSISEADLGTKDPLFEEAARLVVNSQQGSTSSIQRRFSIGYNRAGRIIDQLEAAGVVGPFEGSKARQVLIPDEYSLEILLKNLGDKF